MIEALPTGSKMIATGVISPFLVPMKVTLLVAFVVALALVLQHRFGPLLRRVCMTHESALIAPLVISVFSAVRSGCRLLLFLFWTRI